jgi:hypothetical protein
MNMFSSNLVYFSQEDSTVHDLYFCSQPYLLYYHEKNMFYIFYYETPFIFYQMF